MKIINQIERIKIIDTAIHAGKTGTPKEFACKLGISRRHLYRLLEMFKDYGAIIKYSRKEQSFYYEQPFKLESIGIQPKTIDKDNMGKINGGSHYPSSLFYLFEKQKNQLILENFLPCFAMRRNDFIFTTC